MSAAYQKMKGAAGNVKGAAGSVANSKTANEAKSVLADLISYAATIIIALALNSLTLGIFQSITDSKTVSDISLVLLWVYAAITIVLAMLVCYITGESLSFGEDLA